MTSMNTITVQEIQRDPLAFVRRIEGGEALVVVRDERPVAQVHPVPALLKERRPYGLCVGEFAVPPDFDDPLPDEVLLDFETP
jgi:antitoxin (DNA-binding transcriptional repressor) of toxin-antitoxin stability system